MTSLQNYLYVFYRHRILLGLIIVMIIGLGIYEAIEMKWSERNGL